MDVQIVKFAILLALRKIQFAPGKRLRVIRNGQSLPCLLFGKRYKWRQPFGATSPNRVPYRSIAYVREEKERTRCAELLSLKQQWRPRTEQEKSGHSAVTCG